MTKAQRTRIVNALRKLTSWKWYNINPKDFTKEEMIEVLKSCIDAGEPYHIRGDWESFRLETKGGPLWQQCTDLPPEIKIEVVPAGQVKVIMPKENGVMCFEPEHVKVYKGDMLIAIENILK